MFSFLETNNIKDNWLCRCGRNNLLFINRMINKLILPFVYYYFTLYTLLSSSRTLEETCNGKDNFIYFIFKWICLDIKIKVW